MPARDPVVRAISCRIAAIERHHPGADTAQLRRDLQAAQAAAYIRQLGGLTTQQRSRLAVLLLTPDVGGAA